MFSIAVNGILGFAITVAICFCLGDIETALDSPTGFPFLEMFFRATNNLSSATAMAVLIELLIIFCHISIMAAASRMMWAFARDFGLPGSKYLNRVRQSFHIYPSHIFTIQSSCKGRESYTEWQSNGSFALSTAYYNFNLLFSSLNIRTRLIPAFNFPALKVQRVRTRSQTPKLTKTTPG